jgi:hypothetical protein
MRRYARTPQTTQRPSYTSSGTFIAFSIAAQLSSPHRTSTNLGGGAMPLTPIPRMAHLLIYPLTA